MGELLKQATSDVGFNAQTGEYVHMIEKGIMDPTKVSVCVRERARRVSRQGIG